VRTVPVRLLPGLLAAAALLLALQLAVGLTPAGWAVATSFALATLVLLGHGLVREGAPGPRPADQVTLARVALTGGVAALVAGSFVRSVDSAVVVTMALLALVLDTVDGQVARRTRTESALGARFDMEVDAFLILVLSVAVSRSLGPWVLLIGAARYLLLAAGALWPWLRHETPPRYWAKIVAATQGLVLTAVVAGVLPRPVALLLTAAALALLSESFGRQVLSLRGQRLERAAHPVARRWAGRGFTVVAVLLVWVALAWPYRLDRLSVGAFVQIPVEGLALTAAALVLPPRVRRALAAGGGAVLGVLVLLKVLDMGYYAELDRAFNPVVEWSSLGPAVGVLRDSQGSLRAYLVVGGALLLAAAIVALLSWAALRVTSVGARHRRGASRLVAVLGVAWVASATLGLDAVPRTPVASSGTSSFAATEVRNVAAAVRDRQRFPQQLTAADPYSTSSTDDLLAGLRGKDVIVAFVESYGQTAVQGSSFAPGVDAVLDRGTKALTAAGFASRSGFLTSPTFGGLSWLAHSTLQSGLWIDNQQRYGQLVQSDRYTLTRAFGRAGWRTVVDDPANTGPWPEGSSFYHYDQQYNAVNTGYQGPRFSYATMPDQFTLKAFQQRELRPGHAPVMAELDLVSSHYPWTPLPRIVDWNAIGDGSIYDPMPAQGPTVPELYRNYDDVRASYGRSVQYSIDSLVSFVQNAHDDNLVLVLLGDHQPAPKVSGPGATHDVPISLVTRDQSVLDRIASWQWQPGLRPGADAPVWPMDTFRNRFLDAFDGTPAPPLTAAMPALLRQGQRGARVGPGQ
jgi:phosphatidylglycerophosphate synthase